MLYNHYPMQEKCHYDLPYFKNLYFSWFNYNLYAKYNTQVDHT